MVQPQLRLFGSRVDIWHIPFTSFDSTTAWRIQYLHCRRRSSSLWSRCHSCQYSSHSSQETCVFTNLEEVSRKARRSSYDRIWWLYWWRETTVQGEHREQSKIETRRGEEATGSRTVPVTVSGSKSVNGCWTYSFIFVIKNRSNDTDWLHDWRRTAATGGGNEDVLRVLTTESRHSKNLFLVQSKCRAIRITQQQISNRISTIFAMRDTKNLTILQRNNCEFTINSMMAWKKLFDTPSLFIALLSSSKL